MNIEDLLNKIEQNRAQRIANLILNQMTKISNDLQIPLS